MWHDIREELVTHLQALIRIDTTNPPGNETAAASYVARVLAQEGIESQVLEFAPGRGSAIACLPGSGANAPLLCLSHLDVVPARLDEWQHPPFAGHIADGYLWGRGAVDSKNTTVIQMMAMLLIKRLGIPLSRNLLLAATADEEVSGHGARFLATKHPKTVEAQYAFNEAGGEGFILGGKQFYTLQVAQKGGMNLRIISRGTGGHSSVPHERSAIADLAEAILRLKKRSMPHHVIETTRRFFLGMADNMANPQLATALRNMLDPQLEQSAVRTLGVDLFTQRMFTAMLRNIAETTVVHAGNKSNVIPAIAEAVVSTRTLPGISERNISTEISTIIGNKVQLVSDGFNAGLEFILHADDPMFLSAARAIKKREPNAILLPYLICGGTDAMYLAPLGTKVIGFVPMAPDPAGSVLKLAHTNEERISIRNLLFGAQVLLDTICRLNGSLNPLA